MEEYYAISQATVAPCSNPGYFSDPPVFNIGLCLTCQASITSAKSKVEDYRSLVNHTKEVEASTAKANQQAANNTQLNQTNTQKQGSAVESQGADGERQKRDDAGTLRDHANACKDTVDCKGNIAPEDHAAGKTEKEACEELAKGAGQVHDEKSENASRMKKLDQKGQQLSSKLQNVSNVEGILGTTPDLAAATMATVAISRGTESIDAIMAVVNARLGDSPGNSSTAVRRVVEAEMENLRKGAAAEAKTETARYGAGIKSPFGSGRQGLALTSAEDSSNRAGGDNAASTLRKTIELQPAEEESTAVPGSNEKPEIHAYSDPLLAYQSKNADGRLVNRLRKSPELRKQLRAQIAEMAAKGAEAGEMDPFLKERIDFFRKTLAEAESGSKRGSMDALLPLENVEIFGMDADETAREIRRLTSSLESDVSDEALNNSLFPRVHQAIRRNLISGKVRALKSQR